ncbi:DUF4184 family protein [Streptomyces sp. ODS05-4]|uniref:DUF4184 family protein n=1 Tax=Streptomyces sp. ODS05-4 TaxID=2944939 RepID=UPI00210E20A0|nr:DUF4184 family protein [Streptomyces sp. ODS05-4]
MPFTLAHPAAVLPLLRPPLEPAALVAGAMAPDLPYFLSALGLRPTSHTWYEPLTNASVSHSPTGAVTSSLLLALCLLALWRLLRAPVAALLPAGRSRQKKNRHVEGVRGYGRRAGWTAVSALIGIASHVAWDALAVGGPTIAGLVDYTSTALGLALVGWYGWRHRDRLRTGHAEGLRMSAGKRRSVVAGVVLSCAVGAAVKMRSFDAYRYTTESDFSRPITQALPGGGSMTTYPTQTVEAPWDTALQALLHDTAIGAGAGLIVFLLAYGAAWHGFRLPGAVRPPGPGSRRPGRW